MKTLYRFAVVLCASIVGFATAQPIVVESIDLDFPGGPARGFFARVDLLDPSVQVVVTSGTACGNNCVVPLVPVNTWFTQNELDLAINANFFGSLGNGTGQLLGLSVSDGELVSNPRQINGVFDPAFGIQENGLGIVGRINQTTAQTLRFGVAGIGEGSGDSLPGSLLVDNGVNTGATARVSPTTREPRTAVAVNQAGTQLLIAVVDGRQRGYSQGITLPDLANLLIEKGAWNAVALDGGGSSSFVHKDAAGTVVTNSPSDGSFRAVANHLGIRLVEPAPPAELIEERPIRGAWLRPDLNDFLLDQLLDNMAAAGMTDLFLETFYHGLATHTSSVFNNRFNTDKLLDTMQRAEKRGIRVHAWLESAYWSFGGSGDYILNANPEWKIVTDTGLTNLGDIPGQVFVNLAHPGVQAKLADLCTELANNYPGLWGIHTDYHRFPLDNNTGDSQLAPYSFDAWTRAQFQAQFGVDPLVSARFPSNPFYNQFVAFRRLGIAQAAQSMNNAILATDSGKQFSGAVFATAIADRFGNPNSSQLVKMQDWPLMAANGWLPIVIPMAYGSTSTNIRNDLLAAKNQANGSRIVPGLAIINPANRPGVVAQLDVVYDEDFDSFVFFDANALVNPPQNRIDLSAYLAANGPFQRADLNRNGRIDAADWNLFFALWTGTPASGGGIADVNNDGQLTQADEDEFLHQFRAFRFGADGQLGEEEYQLLLQAFTLPGQIWPRHLYDLTGDGIVDCQDVQRMRLMLTGEVSMLINPDLNGDGLVNDLDVNAFIILVDDQQLIADLDQNGTLDFLDVAMFLNAVVQQCP